MYKPLFGVLFFIVGSYYILFIYKPKPYNYDKIAGTWRSSAQNIDLNDENNVLCAELRTGSLGRTYRNLYEKRSSKGCRKIDGTPFCEEHFERQLYQKDCIHLKSYNVSLISQNGKFVVENTTNMKYYTKTRPVPSIHTIESNLKFFPNDVVCYSYTYHTTGDWCCWWKIVHTEFCGSYAGYDYFTVSGSGGNEKIVGISKKKYDEMTIQKYIDERTK